MGSAGVLAASVLRALISKLVTARNTSRTFLLIFLCSNIGALIGTVAYSHIYHYTLDKTPGGFFIFTIATQLVLLVLSGILEKSYLPSDNIE